MNAEEILGQEMKERGDVMSAGESFGPVVGEIKAPVKKMKNKALVQALRLFAAKECNVDLSDETVEQLIATIKDEVTTRSASDYLRGESSMSDKEGAVVQITCDCGQEHFGIVAGDEGQLLEWYCPVEQEHKRDTNA